MVPADEDRIHWQALLATAGEEWGGRARYAAAMHFFQKGELDERSLEIYRICARLDHEDPLDVMRRWQVGEDWVARIEAARRDLSEPDAPGL